jgi:tetratricopeptide (TPR) repeat protein
MPTMSTPSTNRTVHHATKRTNRRNRPGLGLLLSAMVACTSSDRPPQGDGAARVGEDTGLAAGAARDGLRPKRVEVAPAEVLPGVERGVEIVGMVTGRVEMGLSDIDGVLPTIRGTSPPPGFATALRDGFEKWSATVDVRPEGEGLVVAIVACPTDGPDSACVEGAGTATSVADVHLGVGAALLQLSLAWQVAVRPSVREEWADPESTDAYGCLVAGRALAGFYGQRELTTMDWMARALQLDTRMPVVNWVAARQAYAAGDAERAATLLMTAGQDRPVSPVLAADRAAVWITAGKPALAREAAAQLDGLDPQDPRFMVLRARTVLGGGNLVAAREALDRLAAIHGDDPAIAELRVELAAASGQVGSIESLLRAWRRAAPDEPEPLRRLLHYLVDQGRYSEALELVEPLSRAGADAEARRLGVALAVALGRVDDAERIAADDAAVAARLASRRLGTPVESLDADPDPLVQVFFGYAALRKGDTAGAVARADRALVAEPWLAQALWLRADALLVAGSPEAEDAAALARWVAPPG